MSRIPFQAEVVELGRHAILRGWWGNPWGFESPLRHLEYRVSFNSGGVKPEVLQVRFRDLNVSSVEEPVHRGAYSSRPGVPLGEMRRRR
jgi:hypothetical protein